MHYLDEGSGNEPPILFLHGNPTWSFFYRRLILSLRENSRCIAPDHIGCGLSEKPGFPEFGYDLRGHSENLLSLLEKLKVDRVRLVVHDWGGAIGLTAFRNLAERVDKIVLLNTAAFPSRDVALRILLCRLPLLGSFLVRGLNGFAGPATHMAVAKPLSRETKTGYLLPYDNWTNRVAVWRFVRDIPFEKSHPTLSLLQETAQGLEQFRETPAIACWGMKDFCFHPGFLKEWEKRWPNLEATRIDHAGHYVLEDALEPCIDKIAPFLAD